MQTESVCWRKTQLPDKSYTPDIDKNIMNLLQFLPDNRQNTEKRRMGRDYPQYHYPRLQKN